MIFCESILRMQTPCTSVACASTTRTALIRLYSSLSRLSAWHLTTQRPGWLAGYDLRRKNSLLCDTDTPCHFFIIPFHSMSVVSVILFFCLNTPECKGLESQEGGRQPSFQEQQLRSSLPAVHRGADDRPQQHQDQRKTVLQQSHSWSQGQHVFCLNNKLICATLLSMV